jgi:hypothetical protein
VLHSYQSYYNKVRTHLSLHKDARLARGKCRRSAALPVPILGGLRRRCASGSRVKPSGLFDLVFKALAALTILRITIWHSHLQSAKNIPCKREIDGFGFIVRPRTEPGFSKNTNTNKYLGGLI